MYFPWMYFFNSSSKKDDPNVTKEKTKKAKKAQDSSKFPATDGVSLEYFLSELSDDDNSSW